MEAGRGRQLRCRVYILRGELQTWRGASATFATLALATSHATPPRPNCTGNAHAGLQVETDKATMDFESQDEGVIAKILVEAGAEVKVGDPIMVRRLHDVVLALTPATPKPVQARQPPTLR